MNSSEAVLRDLLEGRALPSSVALGPEAWGFGGVHGGMVLAFLGAAIQEKSEGRALRSLHGRFVRAVRKPFALEAEVRRVGRSVATTEARALVDGDAAVLASGVLGGNARTEAPSFAPPMPSAIAPIESCARFRPPLEFVPFSRWVEIRPADGRLPYSGQSEPELLAWIRIADDPAPIDPRRFTILVDALAPSYGALLSAPAPIPTVELTVRYGAALEESRSPWMLLRARTSDATSDGWIDERIDAWTPEGVHLGSAQQLRLWVTRSAA